MRKEEQERKRRLVLERHQAEPDITITVLSELYNVDDTIVGAWLRELHAETKGGSPCCSRVAHG